MQKIKECNSNNITIEFNSDNGESLLQSIKQIGNLSKIIKPKIKNKININVKDFSPEGLEIIAFIHLMESAFLSQGIMNMF